MKGLKKKIVWVWIRTNNSVVKRKNDCESELGWDVDSRHGFIGRFIE